MRRSTGMIIGLALAAAGAAQAQPAPQNHTPRFAAPGEAPQPYMPQGQAPQDFRPAPQYQPEAAAEKLQVP